MVFQDNESATPLEMNGQLSSGNQTKHINVRCCFIEDCIDHGDVAVEHLGIDDTWLDHCSKPSQGGKFVAFRKKTELVKKHRFHKMKIEGVHWEHQSETVTTQEMLTG